MRDTKEIRSGMRDEIIHSGPGYAGFHGRDAGCFEIDGGIEDNKNHFMTEKKHRIMIIYMKGSSTKLSPKISLQRNFTINLE